MCMCMADRYWRPFSLQHQISQCEDNDAFGWPSRCRGYTAIQQTDMRALAHYRETLSSTQGTGDDWQDTLISSWRGEKDWKIGAEPMRVRDGCTVYSIHNMGKVLLGRKQLNYLYNWVCISQSLHLTCYPNQHIVELLSVLLYVPQWRRL